MKALKDIGGDRMTYLLCLHTVFDDRLRAQRLLCPCVSFRRRISYDITSLAFFPAFEALFLCLEVCSPLVLQLSGHCSALSIAWSSAWKRTLVHKFV